MPSLKIQLCPCQAGQILPLVFLNTRADKLADNWADGSQPGAHQTLGKPLVLPAGSELCIDDADCAEGNPLFQVQGSVFLPAQSRPSPLLQALTRIEGGEYALTSRKTGYSLAVITLSDKGFAGQRVDRSGPDSAALLAANLEIRLSRYFLLPDDPGRLRALALDLVHNQGFDLVVCTGGTGLAPRDLSPEALEPVLDKRLHGFEQAMIAHSLGKTPHAMISRLLAGTIGRSLILALPGSLKAVLENLEAVLPALPHALAKLKGEDADCGG